MTIPNLISIIRLFLVPVIVWLMLTGQQLEAFIVFLIAGLSDLLDGALARLMQSYSELGKYLDPIADKVLLMTVLITLGLQGKLPSWLVILAAFRDFLILGGALLLIINAKPLRIRPLLVSKLNTLLQIALVLVVMTPPSIFLLPSSIITVLIWCVACTSFISGVAYVKTWFDIVNKKDA